MNWRKTFGFVVKTRCFEGDACVRFALIIDMFVKGGGDLD